MEAISREEIADEAQKNFRRWAWCCVRVFGIGSFALFFLLHRTLRLRRSLFRCLDFLPPLLLP